MGGRREGESGTADGSKQNKEIKSEEKKTGYRNNEFNNQENKKRK